MWFISGTLWFVVGLIVLIPVPSCRRLCWSVWATVLIRSPWRWPPRLRPVSNWCRPNVTMEPPLAPATMCVALLVSLHCRAHLPHPETLSFLVPHRNPSIGGRSSTWARACVASAFGGDCQLRNWGEAHRGSTERVEIYATIWRTENPWASLKRNGWEENTSRDVESRGVSRNWGY